MDERANGYVDKSIDGGKRHAWMENGLTHEWVDWIKGE